MIKYPLSVEMTQVMTNDRELREWPISRILSRWRTTLDDHSSKAPVTRHPLAANPDLLGPKQPCLATRDPYLALLPVGLAVPLLLPVARWALTPPFHLFLACKVVCSLWRFPWGFPRRGLPGTVLCGVRTFLPGEMRSNSAKRSSSHPRRYRVRPKQNSRQRGNGVQAPQSYLHQPHPMGRRQQRGSVNETPSAACPGHRWPCNQRPAYAG